MTRYVVIATTVRGVVDPPEPLDEANQWRVNVHAEAVDAVDRDTLRRRATATFQRERDRRMTPDEEKRLRARVA